MITPTPDESDELFTEWSVPTSELPHFSFSLEAWRGFSELGPVWRTLGQTHLRSDLLAVGDCLLNETAGILADVRVAMERSAINGTDGSVCHPYVAGDTSCADMAGAPVSGTHAPYNFRASEPVREA